jgi:hypothetical protein
LLLCSSVSSPRYFCSSDFEEATPQLFNFIILAIKDLVKPPSAWLSFFTCLDWISLLVVYFFPYSSQFGKCFSHFCPNQFSFDISFQVCTLDQDQQPQRQGC